MSEALSHLTSHEPGGSCRPPGSRRQRTVTSVDTRKVWGHGVHLLERKTSRKAHPSSPLTAVNSPLQVETRTTAERLSGGCLSGTF